MAGRGRCVWFLFRPMLFQIGVFGGMCNQIHEIYPIGDQLISSRYSQDLSPETDRLNPTIWRFRNPIIAFTQPYPLVLIFWSTHFRLR